MTPTYRLRSVVLGTPDPRALAAFYRRLVGGEIVDDEDTWVVLQVDRSWRLAFQLEVDHVPPVWPAGAGDQHMQAHLDIAVDHLADATHQHRQILWPHHKQGHQADHH